MKNLSDHIPQSSSSSPGKTEKSTYLFLILFTILGSILRIKDLGTYWISGDESIYIDITQQDFHSFFVSTSFHAHPLLFFLILKLTSLISHNDIVVYRIAPLVAGIASIPAIFCLGRNVFNEKVALISSFLLAVSPACILSSQVIRPYSVILLLAILSIDGVVRFKKNSAGGLRLHFVTAFIGVFTHYGFAILNGILFIFTIITNDKKNDARIKNFLIFHLVVLLLVSIFIFGFHGPSTSIQMIKFAQNEYLNTYFIRDFAHLIFSFIFVFLYFFGSSLSPIFIIFFLSGCFYAIKNKEWKILLFFLLPIVVFILTSILGIYPFGGIRHSILLFPFISIACAIGINSLGILNNRIVAVALSVFLTYYAANYLSEKHIEPICSFINCDAHFIMVENERNAKTSDINSIIERIRLFAENQQTLIFTISAWRRLHVVLEAEQIEDISKNESQVILKTWEGRNIIVLADHSLPMSLCKLLQDANLSYSANVGVIFGDSYIEEANIFKLKLDLGDRIITEDKGFFYRSILNNDLRRTINCPDN